MRTHLSLFTGAGGGELAAHLLGWRTIAYVERDDYCQRVLRARMRDGLIPTACIHDDVRHLDGRAYRGAVDIISAAPPCQPWSVAGKRRGAADERNLWPDVARLVREIRPQAFFMEQAARMAAQQYFGKILSDLASCGYDAEWSCLSARDIGAPHKLRDRLWLLAYRPQFPADCGSEKKMGHSNDSGCVEQCRPLAVAAEIACAQRTSECVRWWDTDPADAPAESRVGRVAHGVASRVDRIRALGNGWVPQMAAVAYRGLIKRAVASFS